jgi:release factor glutamine methyltransferase
VIAEAADRLAAAGCESPRLDAEILLAHVLGIDRVTLITRGDQPLDDAQRAVFAQLVDRRAAREPVAYLVGTKGFRHLDLQVDRRVLIPRPETEHLVEAVLDLPHGARVADVGTGSGAIALALKSERPDLEVVATDASADALDVARENAARLGLAVELHRGDLLADVGGRIDAIVSNPPYVEDGAELAPDIVLYEPALALRAGPDGLDVIRRLLPAAGATAAHTVALEIGAGQAGAVAALMREAGFPEVETISDLAGIERVLVGRRPEA